MKNIFRKKILDKLEKLNIKLSECLSKKIQSNLYKLAEFKRSKKIGLYFSKDNEVQTQNIIVKYLKTKMFYLPKLKNKTMEFKKISSFEDLEVGPFNLMEPQKKCSTITSKNLNLLIMPCVAVDLNGNRIGRGGGYYDRFLQKNKILVKVCLAYEFQILDKIRPQKHDQAVDIIISEKRIIRIKNDPNQSKIIDGKLAASNVLQEIKTLVVREKINAKLAVILIGNDPASELYVRKKRTICKQVGIKFKLLRFSNQIQSNNLKKIIDKLNNDKNTTGILIQLPLPNHLNTQEILNSVKFEKDVDGLTEANQKNLRLGDETLACCAPKGIIKLLEKNRIKTNKKKIALIGYGRLIGKPLATMFKNRNLNFIICTKRTKNLKSEISDADIIVSATGSPKLIKKNMIKKGAVIIDAGTSKLNNKIEGDVDFENVIKKASRITPVPGGVGPMTIAMLIKNVVNAYKKQNEKHNVI